ncbi:hypothetical protein CMI41_00635 [Candidatus Pacearchaeota archaeon]|nr:hypothetical protein [Candidatus Pacearchaeota archaeon]|tara:strand:- start:4334 stop:4864 length:531 start_codon:yes stop_codon:yes gene_type:complete
MPKDRDVKEFLGKIYRSITEEGPGYKERRIGVSCMGMTQAEPDDSVEITFRHKDKSVTAVRSFEGTVRISGEVKESPEYQTATGVIRSESKLGVLEARLVDSETFNVWVVRKDDLEEYRQGLHKEKESTDQTEEPITLTNDDVTGKPGYRTEQKVYDKDYKALKALDREMGEHQEQ